MRYFFVYIYGLALILNACKHDDGELPVEIEVTGDPFVNEYLGVDFAFANVSKSSGFLKGNESIYALDNNESTYWSPSLDAKSGFITVVFEEPRTVDAVLLSEKSYDITSFSIEVLKGNDWQVVYIGDEIGEDRLVTFNKVEDVTEIRLNVKKTNKSIKIGTFQVHKRNSTLKTFRVTSYLISSHTPETWISEYVKNIDYITELELIGAFMVDEKGAIVGKPTVKKSEFGEVKAYLNVNKFHELIGNRDIKKWISITPDIIHLSSNTEVRNAFFANIVTFLEVNNFDGIGIDWEYPNGQAEWNIYSAFLIELNSYLEPKGFSISLAVAGWGVNLSKKAIDIVEHFNIMSYDRFNFDYNKRHETYQLSRADASFLTGRGIPIHKLNYGIGLYSRGIDGVSWGPSYRGMVEVHNIGRENNLINGFYHCGINMCRDKTALAINQGAGGIMVFSLTYDLPATNSMAAIKNIRNVIDEATIQ